MEEDKKSVTSTSSQESEEISYDGNINNDNY